MNHQWDEQYRLQKADKERLAAELRKRSGQSRENSQVQRQSADVPSDKETTKLVQELTKRNDELHEQVIKLTKEQKERDQLWTAAKKMINQERAAKETITQMKLVIYRPVYTTWFVACDCYRVVDVLELLLSINFRNRLFLPNNRLISINRLDNKFLFDFLTTYMNSIHCVLCVVKFIHWKYSCIYNVTLAN